MHVFKYMCTGEVRSAGLLDYKVSGTHFGDCYVITFLWDVT